MTSVACTGARQIDDPQLRLHEKVRNLLKSGRLHDGSLHMRSTGDETPPAPGTSFWSGLPLQNQIAAVAAAIAGSALVVLVVVEVVSIQNERAEILSAATDRRLAAVEADLQELDVSIDDVTGEVATVGMAAAVAENQSLRVTDDVDKVTNDVDDVRHTMDEMHAGLDDSDVRIDILTSVLKSAFHDNPSVMALLDNDRLTEIFPQEFFDGEPSQGAALPASVSAEPLSPDKAATGKSIADHCLAEGTPGLPCYRRYLKRYSLMKKEKD